MSFMHLTGLSHRNPPMSTPPPPPPPAAQVACVRVASGWAFDDCARVGRDASAVWAGVVCGVGFGGGVGGGVVGVAAGGGAASGCVGVEFGAGRVCCSDS